MSEVFLCRTGQLSAASRRELKRAGIIVVEVEDPSRCTFIRAGQVIDGDDMLWAACDAMRRGGDGSYGGDKVAADIRERFAVSIFELVDAAARTARKKPAPISGITRGGDDEQDRD